MFNSLVRVGRVNCSRWFLSGNSLAPHCCLTQERYASNSRKNQVYNNFMSNNPDLTLERDEAKKSKWLSFNDRVFPPLKPTEERRPAYVCHELINVKYSVKKMWYICAFIRGMQVEEAIRQLDYICRKGSVIAKRAINEAVEMAVNEHNVEFKTNLWIAECFCGRGLMMKGLRRHAKGRVGLIHYRYCNFYIRLEEGEPPADYLNRGDRSGPTLLEKWIQEIRNRKIIGSL